MITSDSLNKLVDAMNEETEVLIPLLDNSTTLGSEENYEDTVARLYQSGYVDGLETAIELLRGDLSTE